jgi:U-box domain
VTSLSRQDKRGRNFERKAIVEWLDRGKDTCPLTREPLGYRSLISNVGLRTRVEQWKRENGYQMKSPEEAETERMEEQKFMFMIEAPPNSELEDRWNRNLEEWERLHQQRRHGESPTNHHQRRRRNSARQGGELESSSHHRRRNARQEEGGEYSSGGHRRRNARNDQVQGTTGFSPATQRRRLAGLLNVVRRAPLTDN